MTINQLLGLLRVIQKGGNGECEVEFVMMDRGRTFLMKGFSLSGKKARIYLEGEPIPWDDIIAYYAKERERK